MQYTFFQHGVPIPFTEVPVPPVRSRPNSAVAHEIRKKAGSSEIENQPTQASFAYRSLSADARGLDIFSRCETRYDRQLSRAIQRFNEVRDRREKKMFSPNDPNLSGKLL